ncbi:hypothetical protein BKA56DRAFT_221276 [Ilyonectria sp. MPI-CAGE-AT-0026]|nr:hypothetical protein BKA56DRAFT_221276 [Ilyonectria sp. MPI-CAGE-AT-0026]
MTPGPSTFVVGTSQEQEDIQDYYNNLSYQPATVDPSTLFSDPGPSSAAQNFGNYDSPDPYYAQPSASSAAPNRLECEREDCNQSFERPTELNKHMKTHTKPVKCAADPGCKERRAEQRDMDRHYSSAHKSYARLMGIPDDDYVCAVCSKTFTRHDNLLKHMRNLHS